MIRLSLVAAVLGLSAAIVVAKAASPDTDYWSGPYMGPTIGRGIGTAEYVFWTDGYYNDAIGDRFTQDLAGEPWGWVLGHNWRSGNVVFGVETFVHSHPVKAADTCLSFSAHTGGFGDFGCGDPSPFAGHEGEFFDFKGHWFTGLNARIGYAHNRFLFYAQGGPVLGHLVSRVDDEGADLKLWYPGSVLGLTHELGVEFAFGRRWAVGIGVRTTRLLRLNIAGESVFDTTGLPAGAGTATDHSIFFTSHALVTRLVFRPGNSQWQERRDTGPFGWGGTYFGIFIGALWQEGFQIGYDYLLGDRYLVGASLQGSRNICCLQTQGVAYEAHLNARAGYIWRDDVLAYAEVGYGYQNGAFFGVIEGNYFSAGLGLEFPIMERVTAFIEFKGVADFGGDHIEGNVQGGFNFQVGRK